MDVAFILKKKYARILIGGNMCKTSLFYSYIHKMYVKMYEKNHPRFSTFVFLRHT